MTLLADQQLIAIRGDIELAVTIGQTGVVTGALAHEAWGRVGNEHAAALLAHVDHLTGELAAARGLLGGYGTPVTSFPRSRPRTRPTPGAAPCARSSKPASSRANGRSVAVICPEGFRCPAGPLAVFNLTKRGLIPARRSQRGHLPRCQQEGHPATPRSAAHRRCRRAGIPLLAYVARASESSALFLGRSRPDPE
ncbi:hypothetical protein ABIA38_003867 [Embleya sp. AB8]